MNRLPPDSARAALARIDRSLRERLGLDLIPDGVNTEFMLEAADATVAAALAHIDRVPTDADEFSSSVVSLLDAQLRLRKSTTGEAVLRPGSLAGAIRRVAAQSSAASVAHQACIELTTVGDFSAAVISEVDDDHFTIIAGANTTGKAVPGNERIPRRYADRENLCVEQRSQFITCEKPATVGFAVALGTPEYMTAPIICGNSVPALIHTSWPDDRTRTGDDQTDGQLIGLFADAVGAAYSREIYRHQATRRHQILLARTAAMLNEASDLLNLDLTLGAPLDGDVAATAEAPTGDVQLTPREAEVMAMIADGATNAEIAERLFISLETVKSHVKKILRKTGSINRSEAIARYLNHR